MVPRSVEGVKHASDTTAKAIPHDGTPDRLSGRDGDGQGPSLSRESIRRHRDEGDAPAAVADPGDLPPMPQPTIPAHEALV